MAIANLPGCSAGLTIFIVFIWPRVTAADLPPMLRMVKVAQPDEEPLTEQLFRLQAGLDIGGAPKR
jgi:hypothetical protein